MSTPLSTPVRHAKLGIASTKSLPLANEFKKLLSEQHQRLTTKHQQDLDLIDDIRSYVKARLSIERDYTSAMAKLTKQHSNHIAKKFTLLDQCDPIASPQKALTNEADIINRQAQMMREDDSRLQKRLASSNGVEEPDKPCSLYKVWSEHITRLQTTTKNRANQFEQLIMVVDKLKDIRSHKASIGKKCLDTHIKRIHDDIMVSIVDVERSRKLYYEDESQAKKARENEEKIKKKRSGLLTKFTDLQAKKEKTSAQREANDIQSTQARNDYIMALAAANAHLEHYYQRDLIDFLHLIDDGVLDHCKIFMATLSECDINSLKDSLTHAQYWSKMINLTSLQKTNAIYLDCEQSMCLRYKGGLLYEPCNNDPIHGISLEHNADYALQHEIDKWFTWFKKECRSLSQLMHQLDLCQHAFAEGKKNVELNGQTVEELEPKIIELKQQIRKSEAAKLKAQARLKVIKEGGMQIEEWSTVESEIRADMARVQEETAAKRLKEMVRQDFSDDRHDAGPVHLDAQDPAASYVYENQNQQVRLQISKDSDESEAGESVHNLASVSRSTSNLVQKQQNAATGYSALTDPSLVWQDDYSSAWDSNQGNQNVVVTNTFDSSADDNRSKVAIDAKQTTEEANSGQYSLLGTTTKQQQNAHGTSMTVQSSSPLSAIVDGQQTTQSPYQGMMSEAYKSDYECDYNRTGHMMRSTASSAEPFGQYQQQTTNVQQDPFGKPLDELAENQQDPGTQSGFDEAQTFDGAQNEYSSSETYNLLNKRVIGIYSFDKNNDDDLAFNENDVLFITEINDANWVKARNEVTGEQGYVPASYVRLLDSNETSNDAIGYSADVEDPASLDSKGAWNTSDIQQGPEKSQGSGYCRALYDYEPEQNTYEEDGWPHLALVQGEVMRIIDQGEDDGWWLVEKENSSTKGHVPSMLVEEVEENAEEEEDYEDEGNVSQYSDEHDGSVKAMPTFEPPVLEKASPESENIKQEAITDITEEVKLSHELEKASTAHSSSLVATSFIIIEPTPEVESRRFEDSIGRPENTKTDEGSGEQQIVTSEKPPNNVSYSVVNEDFVLEGPTRKPHHQSECIQHHETPTILEENITEDTADGGLSSFNEASSGRAPEGNYEPLSEVDSIDMPAPPSVVIETFEDDKQERSPNLSDEDDDVESERESPYSQTSPTNVEKKIIHTGNVDISPILRHRAEEFSKLIIAEAMAAVPLDGQGLSSNDPDEDGSM